MTSIVIEVITRVITPVAWKHTQEIAMKNVKSLNKFAYCVSGYARWKEKRNVRQEKERPRNTEDDGECLNTRS